MLIDRRSAGNQWSPRILQSHARFLDSLPMEVHRVQIIGTSLSTSTIFTFLAARTTDRTDAVFGFLRGRRIHGVVTK